MTSDHCAADSNGKYWKQVIFKLNGSTWPTNSWNVPRHEVVWLVLINYFQKFKAENILRWGEERSKASARSFLEKKRLGIHGDTIGALAPHPRIKFSLIPCGYSVGIQWESLYSQLKPLVIEMCSRCSTIRDYDGHHIDVTNKMQTGKASTLALNTGDRINERKLIQALLSKQEIKRFHLFF